MHRPLRSRTNRTALALGLCLAMPLWIGGACDKHEATGQQTFASPQVDPIVLDGNLLYVANTTSGTVSVIDTTTNTEVGAIEVGLEPCCLALRPTANELWVSNHVSDTVSVIDLAAGPTFRMVVATIQEFDGNGATLFDEPAGIAFSDDGARAYVALSATNDIAVVDAATRAITTRVHITAQEPRAIAFHDDKVFVAAFESFNQSELSLCPDGGSAPQCTLDIDDLGDFILTSPNIPGADSRIVFDPDMPDRDLYVIDADPVSGTFHQVVDIVSGVGTLLYGVAVSSTGTVYLTQTEARNELNGGENDVGQNNLPVLDNRMFHNEVARVDCASLPCSFSHASDVWDLETGSVSASDALARPYGVAISDDDGTLVATAAGVSRIFTVNTATGAVLDTLDLDAGVPADAGRQIPKGVALRSNGGTGAPETAYVLNSLENTVSVVDVSSPAALTHTTKIPVGSDPTPVDIREGRIQFNNAFASSKGTFSCAGCHPDGNTDQLLWRIGGACFFGACNEEDEIRSTMPVRGLRNTLPLHWDGTLGDPFGGPNGAVGTGGNGGTDCTLGDADGDLDCFRDLVNGSLSGVMCDQAGGCATGPSGAAGLLTDDERDDMALFLAHVSYPPARSRPYDDVVTSSARQGFADFWIESGGVGGLVGVTSCGDMNSGCHSLPLGTVDNSVTLGAFDAPTMRGLNDRALQFSLGVTMAEETLVFAQTQHLFDLIGIGFPIILPASEIPWDPVVGIEEEVTFAAAFLAFFPVYGKGPLDMISMIDEMSTGHSGAFGRQVTLDATTTAAGPALTATEDLMNRLEQADEEDLVNLRATGVRQVSPGTWATHLLTYRVGDQTYKNAKGSLSFTHADLISLAQSGDLVMTLTGAVPRNFGRTTHHQPLLSVTTTGDKSVSGGTTNPAIPFLPGDNPMQLVGIDVRSDAQVYVDGVRDTGASISCDGGSFNPYCDSQTITITLASPPVATGMHLLQVQNPKGPLSVELPICVGTLLECGTN